MMPVYQKSLGDTVRKARHKAKLSQSELAEVLGIGLRTVGDIKNYLSNLTMETLYPLIRTLNIDPADIFYPEHSDTTNGAAAELKAKLATCTEAEAILLNEICEAALRTLRSPKSYSVYKQK